MERYRDRNDHYVPENLRRLKRHVEVRSPFQPGAYELLRELRETYELLSALLEAFPEVTNNIDDDVRSLVNTVLSRVRQGERYASVTGELAFGSADELNRDHHGDWRWVKIDSQSGPIVNENGEPEVREHWSHFEGHVTQVDVELSTLNRRVVNDWKGRDEVRADGTWRIYLNRLPVLEDDFNDPLEALLTIRGRIRQLLNHPVLSAWTREELESLCGRPIYYHDQPARISGVYDTRITIVGDPGPIHFAYDEYGLYHDDTSTTDILDPHIWWWREQPKLVNDDVNVTTEEG